jgi:FtsH-binding integral membrane protein
MKSEEDTVTNMNSTIRQPSAFLPVAMSLVALALVLGHVALFGVVHEADEGTAAHIWQILMAAQVPIMAFFAIKYLPQKPKQALLILTLQIVAALTACAPVFFLKL